MDNSIGLFAESAGRKSSDACVVAVAPRKSSVCSNPPAPGAPLRWGLPKPSRLFWQAWAEQGRVARWLFSGARASAEFFEAPVYRARQRKDWLTDAVFIEIMKKQGFRDLEERR